jgi:hypothetical protein
LAGAICDALLRVESFSFNCLSPPFKIISSSHLTSSSNNLNTDLTTPACGAISRAFLNASMASSTVGATRPALTVTLSGGTVLPAFAPVGIDGSPLPANRKSQIVNPQIESPFASSAE